MADQTVELIDRNAAMKAVRDDLEWLGSRDGPAAVSAIMRLPVIEAAPLQHGWWLPIEANGYADGAPVWDKWECSECGHEHDGEEDTLTEYCPDCGRKMLVDNDRASGVGQTFSPD